MPVSPELRAKVTRSRAAQGLPPVIGDPATLKRVTDALRLVDLEELAVPLQRHRKLAKDSTTAAA